MYLPRRCGVGSELLRHGKWFRQQMAAHVGRDTNIGCVSGHSGQQEENATQIWLASFTLPPHLPVHLLPTIQSYLPTLVSRASWTAVTEQLRAPHSGILGVEDYQVADPVSSAPPPWEAVYNCCSRRTPVQPLQAALVATDSTVN